MAAAARTMRALVARDHGVPTKVLELVSDFPVPTIVKPSQLIVRVVASCVNPVDAKQLTGDFSPMLYLRRKPCVLGRDFAGVVVEVGEGVTDLKPGDAVVGHASSLSECHGAWAEFALTDRSIITRKPAELTFAEAAALPVVALTAYVGLFSMAKLKAGARVFVSGGSSAVGSQVVMQAKGADMYVAATCSGRNAEFVKNLGADKVIDYTAGDIAEAVRDDERFDLFFDCVGAEDEPKLWAQVNAVLRPGAPFISTVGPTVHSASLRNVSYLGWVFIKHAIGRLFGGHPYQVITDLGDAENLPRVMALATAKPGAIRAPVDRVVTLAELPAAIEYSNTGRARGKIMVKVSEAEYETA